MRSTRGRGKHRAPPFFSFSRNERGISEVVTVLLLTGLITSFAYFFLSASTRTVQSETSGVVDVIRAAGHRQNQLLSVILSQKSGDNKSENVYMYAYGTEDVQIRAFYLNGENVVPSYSSLFQPTDNVTKVENCYNIPSRVLVWFSFPLSGSLTNRDNFQLVAVSKWNAFYVFEVSA